MQINLLLIVSQSVSQSHPLVGCLLASEPIKSQTFLLISTTILYPFYWLRVARILNNLIRMIRRRRRRWWWSVEEAFPSCRSLLGRFLSEGHERTLFESEDAIIDLPPEIGSTDLLALDDN